jgi:phospholipid transport system transporter-binding protein
MTGLCAATPVVAGAFSAVDDGARWVFAGNLTIDSAATVLSRSRSLALPATGVVDFGGLTQADSAALAVMVALKRRALAEGRTLTLASLPATLTSLAVVYGVEELVAS